MQMNSIKNIVLGHPIHHKRSDGAAMANDFDGWSCSSRRAGFSPSISLRCLFFFSYFFVFSFFILVRVLLLSCKWYWNYLIYIRGECARQASNTVNETELHAIGGFEIRMVSGLSFMDMTTSIIE